MYKFETIKKKITQFEPQHYPSRTVVIMVLR